MIYYQELLITLYLITHFLEPNITDKIYSLSKELLEPFQLMI